MIFELFAAAFHTSIEEKIVYEVQLPRADLARPLIHRHNRNI
jgi:hypothetical protein